MNNFSPLLDSARVILFHKQSTSAMTRFLKCNDGGVCIGEPLPKLAQVVTGEEVSTSGVVPHPGAIAAELENWLGLAAGSLEVDADYQELIEIPGKILHVYLMRFTSMDPPFAEAEGVGATFIALTQARGLSPVELELLRSAYTMIMEG